MNRQTKLAALLIAVLMSITLLSGCANNPADSDDGTKQPPQVEEKIAITIDETVLFTYEGLTVSATGIKESVVMGTGLELLFDNKGSKSYSVGCNALIVNNYMIPNLLATEIGPENQVTDTIYISSGDIEKTGMERVGVIEIDLYVYDSQTFETVYTPDRATVKTSLFDKIEYVNNDAGDVIVDSDGLKVVYKGINIDSSFWGAEIELYIENMTDTDLVVGCGRLSVNGVSVTPIMSCSVSAGKKAMAEIAVISDELDKNSIKKIKNAELTINAYTKEGYNEVFKSEIIKVKAK